MRYMECSAHERAFPVPALGILATLIPARVAASISTPAMNQSLQFSVD